MSTPNAAPAGSDLDESFYAALVEGFADWQRDEASEDNPQLRDDCRRLLEREARLLDQRRFEDWLALLARQCLYWVPTTPGAGDPRREVCVAFDDRRRLEDRIFRLRTGFAWSQVPASRTIRMVSNVEVFRTADAANFMVRSNLMISEFRAGDTQILSGWCGHRLVRGENGWQIAVKQVNLINCDQNLRNPSFIF
jgi:3-phenylpropionate/cinnamic acid dioxygenase small subunit